MIIEEHLPSSSWQTCVFCSCTWETTRKWISSAMNIFIWTQCATFCFTPSCPGVVFNHVVSLFTHVNLIPVSFVSCFSSCVCLSQMASTQCRPSVFSKSPSSLTRCCPTVSRSDWPTPPRSTSCPCCSPSSWTAWPASCRPPPRTSSSSTSKTTRTSALASSTSACLWPCPCSVRDSSGLEAWATAPTGLEEGPKAEVASSSAQRSSRSGCIWTAASSPRSPPRKFSPSTTTSACESRVRTTWSVCPCWSSTAWPRLLPLTPSCSDPSTPSPASAAAVPPASPGTTVRRRSTSATRSPAEPTERVAAEREATPASALRTTQVRTLVLHKLTDPAPLHPQWYVFKEKLWRSCWSSELLFSLDQQKHRLLKTMMQSFIFTPWLGASLTLQEKNYVLVLLI